MTETFNKCDIRVHGTSSASGNATDSPKKHEEWIVLNLLEDTPRAIKQLQEAVDELRERNHDE